MYLEAVFSFYVLLYHFVGHSFFGLIFFGSFSDIIKRNFSLTLAKLNFYVDMSVWLFVGKQYYRLHMHGLRKLINRPHFHQLIPIPTQILQIPCQCGRITAHVHDPLRLHLHHSLKQRFLAAFPRRIHHDHVSVSLFSRMCLSIICIISRQNLFCFSNIKLCILDSVDLRIFSGVLDGLRNDLHTVDLFRLLRQKQGYRSDSTVEIPDRLISF